MASNSTGQGRGFDRQIDKKKEEREKKARGSGASSAPAPDSKPVQSLGDIMTPSQGRAQQASAPEDYEKRVEENKNFLKSPETQAFFLQLGTSLLSSAGNGGGLGSNFGRAFSDAMGAPGRMNKEMAEREIEAGKLQLQQDELGLRREQLGLDRDKLELEKKGGGGTPSDITKLLNEADAMEAAGDPAKAALLRSAAWQKANEFSLTSGIGVTPPASVTGMGKGKNASGEQGAQSAGDPFMPSTYIIPGSKADIEKQEAEAQVKKAKEMQIQKGGLVLDAADKISAVINNSNMPNFTVTGLGSVLSIIPGTDANTIANYLNVLKSNVGFDQLQAMRDASETGGALGQVTEKENELLQSVLVSLSQGNKASDLIDNIQVLKFLYDPSQIELRNRLSQELASGRIDANQALNKFNELKNDYVEGLREEKPDVEVNTPPAHLPDDIKAGWGNASAADRKKALELWPQ